MNHAVDARKLANFIEGLAFHQNYVRQDNIAYTHIGALYTNIVLQAGLNYKSVVKPRVEWVASNYPSAHSVSGFLDLIKELGLERIMNWKHPEKIGRMNNVIEFSINNSINTCEDLSAYLQVESNQEEFLKIKGFGPKTLDYTLKLLSFDTIAVDRHIFSFVALAGLEVADYRTTKKVVEFAADLLQVPRYAIDYSIWNYMSEKNDQGNSRQIVINF